LRVHGIPVIVVPVRRSRAARRRRRKTRARCWCSPTRRRSAHRTHSARHPASRPPGSLSYLPESWRRGRRPTFSGRRAATRAASRRRVSRAWRNSRGSPISSGGTQSSIWLRVSSTPPATSSGCGRPTSAPRDSGPPTRRPAISERRCAAAGSARGFVTEIVLTTPPRVPGADLGLTRRAALAARRHWPGGWWAPARPPGRPPPPASDRRAAGVAGARGPAGAAVRR